ncbi:hypothetical protein [Candidatus Clostridium helianthi]|uniref:Uncharacterized protein n=1 Tax=Candidatus Clostridium helianthi TaxID=3381660 RepID=A0ABW8RZG8_9CLOT
MDFSKDQARLNHQSNKRQWIRKNRIEGKRFAREKERLYLN